MILDYESLMLLISPFIKHKRYKAVYNILIRIDNNAIREEDRDAYQSLLTYYKEKQ